MNNQTSAPPSLVNAILEEFRNGVHPSKISLKFPWVHLSATDRQTLIEKARGYNQARRSLLRLLAFMVEDVPIEYRWDQMDILSTGFEYLDWDDSQKQIALKKMEQALTDLEYLVKQRHPELQAAYNRYSARFYLLRGGFFYEKMEFLHAVEDLNRSADAFRQAGLNKQADRLGYIVQGIAWLLEEKNQPLESGADDSFLYRFLRKEEQKQIDKIAVLRERADELEEKVHAKVDLLKSVEEKIHLYQHQLNELQQQISEYEVYRDFLGELRQHADAPLWQEIIRLAMEQGEIDELSYLAIERLVLTKKEWDRNLLLETLLRLGKMEEDTARQVVKGFSLFEEKTAETDDEELKAARLIVEGWESVFDGLEQRLVRFQYDEDFVI